MASKLYDPVLFFLIFFGLLGSFCLFAIVKPESIVNATVKYFKWSVGLLGFECEIKPKPQAVTIVRLWNVLCLMVIGILVFLTLTDKLR